MQTSCVIKPPITSCVIKPPISLVEEIENRKGRKPKPKRKKGKHESPTKKKKKVSRERRIMHCARCDFAGHNASKCPNGGVERYRKPRKKKVSNADEAYDSTNTIRGEDGYDSMTQPTQD